jgi:transposase
MDRDSLIVLLAQGLSVEKIAERFGKHPSTVAYWMGRHGLEAVHRERHGPKGGIERERLEALVGDGFSIAQIAAEVGLSKAAVRHWLRRYELRTKPAMRAAVTKSSRAAGLNTIRRRCPEHGDTEFALEGRGYYRCKRCRSAGISSHRRKLKQLLVAEAGGRCQVCGYDRCVAALEFHHLDPEQKRLGISAVGLTLSLEALRAEAAKCVLVCSNCHAELESGTTELAVKCPNELELESGSDAHCG